MQLTLLKSKIHRAIVTGASLDYEGSLTISADLAGITIMSFARYAPEETAIHRPHIVILNDKNETVRYEGGDSELTNSSAAFSPVGGVEALVPSACSVRSADDTTAATTACGFAFPRGKSSELSLNSIT